MSAEECTYSQEEFYEKLLANCASWRRDEGDEVVFREQSVTTAWVEVAGNHPGQLGHSASLDIKDGVVFGSGEDNGYYSSFVYGGISRDRWEPDHLEFFFSFAKKRDGGRVTCLKDLSGLFRFHSTGLITLDGLGRPYIDCWANREVAGGKVNLPPERFFSGEGLQDCFNIIQVARLAFVRGGLRSIL